MKLVVITPEKMIKKEAGIIHSLFESGLATLHLRKPFSSKADVESLLLRIDPVFHSRIVLHDHFSLTAEYDLKGVHLNRRNLELPEKRVGSVSRSCHSLEELSRIDQLNYVFLSPVFDSISKTDYNQAFTYEQLKNALASRLINEKVIALGGISQETIPLSADYGFGGVAVLGSLWGNDENETAIINRFIQLKILCDQQ